MGYEKTIDKLELNEIRRLLQSHCGHPLSRRWALEDPLAATFAQAEDRLHETSSAMELMRTHPDLPSGSLPDMDSSMEKLGLGYQLNPVDLWYLLLLLRKVREIKRYFEKDIVNPVFNRIVSGLTDVAYLKERLEEVVDEGGEIKDTATPLLKEIRTKIRHRNGDMRKTLEIMLKRSTILPSLQEAVVVQRGEAYCLSVKKEFAYRISGTIMDTSATGSTVFIEPTEIATIRGELNLLHREEGIEIEGILRQVSELARIDQLEVEIDYRNLGAYDYFLARASVTKEYRGYVPKINEGGIIRLRQARHPLLFGNVVSNDVLLGDTFNHLIISGPNTGGKTVLLKMVGLFAYMVSLGLGLSVAEGSEMAWFRKVYADIGDEQSIANSLSTFSGHMKNIKEMLEDSDSSTLLLFDELGNGTDPKEGSGLAMAILEEVHRRGAHSITTTHYGELKVFAFNQKGFSNASMAFDVQTFEPSYRLILGTPGASLGIEVARRMGLSNAVVEHAKMHLDQRELDAGSLLEALENERSILAERTRAVEMEYHEASTLKEEIRKEQERLEKKSSQQADQIVEKARRLLEDARIESEKLIRELKAMKANGPEQSNRIRQELRQMENELFQKKTIAQGNTKHLEKGWKVRVISSDKIGVVLEADDIKRIGLVQIGALRISLPYGDLVPSGDNGKDQGNHGYQLERVIIKKKVPLELDVRGLTVDEALDQIGKYLDEALLARYPSVRIIHGMGTGALRKGIWAYLKGLSSIQSYRYGDASEGSIGATVIQF